MSEPDNKTTAFPLHTEYSTDEGMSLRDYFAAKATEEDIREFMPSAVGDCLQFAIRKGWVKSTCANPPIRLWTEELSLRLRYWAKYAHADAMLEARKP